MRTETPQPIRLSDYRPPAYLVDEIHLDFDLKPSATRVKARLSLRRNGVHAEPLVLNGERLKPISVAIDGRVLAASDYAIDTEYLTIADVPATFALETEVEIDPAANASLDGLYMSGGRFCTQCEAEGFRKITWFPDRPDVLARYTVRIEADRAFHRLLANGNRVEEGPLEGGRHYAVWRDPFPKPCYLFALVAGELDELADSFVTMSGRTIDLRIYVDPGQSERALYAMDALKRSMTFDETAFGREYDLDLFMIVAVRDFNFGAMENKGLNVFNSSLLLADPATATDMDYERIESVVAHEYFHNWTGNRITCRDWFQLCLKEGLTVFRDQSFSAQERGESVVRIKDVRALRTRQFPEDAGPLAHPVRPSSYVKIDNFYTATVYEKGAEIIRMLHTLLGPQAFRAGMDLYFERCDGTAATVEDFVGAFEAASGQDLSRFFAWYQQPGTPVLTVESTYDEAAQILVLSLAQAGRTPADAPLPIPVRLGLLDRDGEVMAFHDPASGAPVTEALVVLDKAQAEVRLGGVTQEPVVSLLRGFSAPVRLVVDAPAKDAYVRLAADPDPFNRWEAGQDLARELILARAAGAPDEVNEERYADAIGRALSDQSAEPAFQALLLALPSESDLALAQSERGGMAERGGLADPAALHEAREALRTRIAVHLSEVLVRLHGAMQDPGEFTPDAAGAGRRALRNAVLDLLAAEPTAVHLARAVGHAEAATNMTDSIGGLNALMQMSVTPDGAAAFEEALSAFYERWKDEPLVVDKWFALQARSPAPDALAKVAALTTHPAFESRNPNRLRALVASFASGNPARFHDPSGAGYRFLADQILLIDSFNPMIAARLLEPLGGWRRYSENLGELMRDELSRIAAAPNISKNVLELAEKALN
ncbi:MAG: aminopeptidase N [Caulobacterales bacterium 32-69-10]|nr:MAG: aminopeptidase N [Caulobacterales bacterium 32-69-10]